VAIRLGELSVILSANVARFNSAMNAAVALVDKVGGQLRSIGAQSAVAGTALGFMGFKAVSAAASANETLNVLQVGFREMTPQVLRWANTLSASVGTSVEDLRKFTAHMQIMFTTMVGNREAAAKMSMGLTELAIDLASLFEISDPEALQALTSAMVGNMETLRDRFGIAMTESALNTHALEMGINKTTKQMNESEKAMLRYNFLLAKGAIAKGDAARTAGSFVRQMVRLKGEFKDTTIALGHQLLPFAREFLVKLRGLLGVVRNLTPEMVTFGLKMGAIATAIAAAGSALGIIGIVVPPIVASLSVLLPVGIAIAGVLAGIGTAVHAWEKDFAGIRTFIIPALADLKSKLADTFGWWLDTLKKIVPMVKAILTAMAASPGLIGIQARVALKGLDIGGKFGKLLGKGAGQVGANTKDAGGLGAVAKSALSASFKAIGQMIAKGLGQFKGLIPPELMDQFKKVFEDMMASLNKIGTGGEKLSDELNNAGDELKKSTFDFSKALMGAGKVAGGITLNAAASGPLGSVLEGGSIGGQVGGPYGAVAGAIAGLLTESTQFQKLLDVVNNTLQVAADTLGQFIKPLTPLIAMVGKLSHVIALVGPGMIVLKLAMQALTPVLKLLFKVFRAFGIAVLKVAKFFADFVGGSKAVNRALRELRNATWDNITATEDMTEAADKASEALYNIPRGFKVALARFAATTPEQPREGGGQPGMNLPGSSGNAARDIWENMWWSGGGQGGTDTTATAVSGIESEGGERMHIGTLVIQATSPREIWDKIQEYAHRDGYRMTGAITARNSFSTIR